MERVSGQEISPVGYFGRETLLNIQFSFTLGDTPIMASSKM